jgi:DNA-binding NtrC family response regulator
MQSSRPVRASIVDRVVDSPHESSTCPLSRVLLLEDDELFAAVVMEFLLPIAAVEWVASAEEAFYALPSEDWDLVIADVNLSGMSGLELVQETKRVRPFAATLILTASASLDTAVARCARAPMTFSPSRSKRRRLWRR